MKKSIVLNFVGIVLMTVSVQLSAYANPFVNPLFNPTNEAEDQGKKQDQGKQGKQEQGQKEKNTPLKKPDFGKGKNDQPQKSQQKDDRGKPQQGSKPQQGGKEKQVGQGNADKGDKAQDRGTPKGLKGKQSFEKSKGMKLNFKHPYHYVYGKWHPYGNHGFYTGREFGQRRAFEARNKHNRFYPVYEFQAIQIFDVIIQRNVFLIHQTDYKITFLRARVIELQRSGTITVIVMENYLNRIVILERRRAALEVSLNVYV